MPVYEYRCTSCSHEFEKVQRISSSTTNECPVCGSVAKREISLSTFQLKGSGFYVNDYGKGKDTPLKKKENSLPSNATQPSATTPASLKSS
jgi:putative FmdB family regulatory protein